MVRSNVWVWSLNGSRAGKWYGPSQPPLPHEPTEEYRDRRLVKAASTILVSVIFVSNLMFLTGG